MSSTLVPLSTAMRAQGADWPSNPGMNIVSVVARRIWHFI